MKSLAFLFFLLPTGWLWGLGLNAGVYTNLKLTEPIVLKKGTYTFINLQMNCIIHPSEPVPILHREGGCIVPPSGVRGLEVRGLGIKAPWLDASKADTVRFVNCRFTAIERGTVLKLGGFAIVENCVFEGMAWEMNVLEKK